MKYLLLRNAAHMPKEGRLGTRYRKVTSYRSQPQDQGATGSQHPRQGVDSICLPMAIEWAQSHVVVSYGKFGSLDNVGVIAKHAVCDYAVMLVYSSCLGF